MTDYDDGEPWTEVDVRDLKLSLQDDNTIEEAAIFLRRSGTVDDVRRKAEELGLSCSRTSSVVLATQ